jgi:hypothetical protein
LVNQSLGYQKAEVVIAGGGTGGVCAAIAAARNGADVLLIEQRGFLGGLFTGGNMILCHWGARQFWGGLNNEIFTRLKDLGAAKFHPDDPPNYPLYHMRHRVCLSVAYDPEMAKLVLFHLAEDAGVRLLLHSFVTRAVTEDRILRGVMVENKSGQQFIEGTIVCDGTGDGDVAASAGASFLKGVGENHQLFAMTMLVRLSHVNWEQITEYSLRDPAWDKAINTAKAMGDLPYYTPRLIDSVPYWGHPRPELGRLWYKDGALLWGGTVEGVDGTDAASLTRAEVECRKQWMSELQFLRKYIPGFASARVEHSGTSIGVRGTRHIEGEYRFTGYDILDKRVFPDAVAYIVPLFQGVPYRCLVPKYVENLVIASKCLSTTPGQSVSGPTLGAYNDMKSISTVMSYGQSAGTAAALCVAEAVTPRALDVTLLQKTLRRQGALVGAETINTMKNARLPFGKSIAELLRSRLLRARQRWERMGYQFSTQNVDAVDEDPVLGLFDG